MTENQRSRLDKLEVAVTKPAEEKEISTERLIDWLETELGVKLPQTAEEATQLLGYSASIADYAAYMGGFTNAKELMTWLDSTGKGRQP